jgi:hypothetical protein
LVGQINDLTAELGNIYLGGNSATDQALKLAGENLAADWNEQTFKTSLGQLRQNLKLRLAAMNGSSPRGLAEPSRYAGPRLGPKPAAPAAHPQDSEAVQWARSNPSDPRAAAILKAAGATP